VLKCLHKNPNNRFASVAELNQALQAASDSVANTGTKQEQYFVSSPPILDQPTISKPLSSVESNQPLYNQGLDNETVPRPSPSPTANKETVTRPLQPIEPDQLEEGTFLHRPSPYLDANNETVPRPVKPIQPEAPEGTIVQSPPTPAPAANKKILPQPVSQTSNNTPDNTIFQVNRKPLENPNNSYIFQKNLWIGLAMMVLAFFAGIFIFSLQSDQGSKNSPNVPNSTQKN
jgi:serine/threonine-protein kinase